LRLYIDLDLGLAESVGRPYSRIRHRCQQQHAPPTDRPSVAALSCDT